MCFVDYIFVCTVQKVITFTAMLILSTHVKLVIHCNLTISSCTDSWNSRGQHDKHQRATVCATNGPHRCLSCLPTREGKDVYLLSMLAGQLSCVLLQVCHKVFCFSCIDRQSRQAGRCEKEESCRRRLQKEQGTFVEHCHLLKSCCLLDYPLLIK